jgi:hypothetical protein
VQSSFPLWLNDNQGATCSMIEILELLGLRRRTGRFHIETAGDTYSIYVDSGHIILASSTDKALRLGLVLLQHGYLKSRELESILHTFASAQTRHSIGKQLVSDGVLSRADLAIGVEAQCIEILAHALDEGEAVVTFFEDQPLPNDLEIVPLNTDKLLRRAESRHHQRTGRRAMERLLPKPGSRLRLTTPILPLAAYLTNSELLVAMTIDRGTTVVDQLLTSTTLSDLTVKRSVIGLMERGLIAVAEPTTGTPRRGDETLT